MVVVITGLMRVGGLWGGRQGHPTQAAAAVAAHTTVAHACEQRVGTAHQLIHLVCVRACVRACVCAYVYRCTSVWWPIRAWECVRTANQPIRMYVYRFVICMCTVCGCVRMHTHARARVCV